MYDYHPPSPELVMLKIHGIVDESDNVIARVTMLTSWVCTAILDLFMLSILDVFSPGRYRKYIRERRGVPRI